MKLRSVVVRLALLVLFVCAEESFAGLRGLGWHSNYQKQLIWTSSTNKVMGEAGQSLPYSETTGSQGAFAQLIWVGPNGVADAFDSADPDGTGGDDSVIDISYSYGASIPGTKSNQIADVTVPIPDVGSAQNGSNYYVRVYNGANPNYGVGVSAITGVVGITYYYESSLHAYDHKGGTQPDIWNFTGGTDRQTSTEIQPVPEPTTLGLMAVGALALAGARRRRRS